MNHMKELNYSLLIELTQSARNTPKGRDHYCLHESLEDSVQRLCVALEPGSYIIPHRHPQNTWELFLILKGAAVALVFDDKGYVRERRELKKDYTAAVEIPGGCWHTVAALREGTILVEIKQGPYLPLDEENIAPWAPAENTKESSVAAAWFCNAFVGDHPPFT